MPMYKIPKPKKVEESDVLTSPFMGRPSVYLPANSEIIESLEIGQEIEVMVKGKVVGLESRKREGEPEDFNEFNIELTSVEAYSENEFEKMSRDED